jgi:WD40 repeat protein
MQRRLQTQALRRRNNTKQVQKERSETSIPSQAANPNLEQNLPTSELSVSEPQIQNWKCVHSLIGHIGGVNSVAINPDGQTLASGSEDTKIKIWNLHTGKEIRTLGGLFAQPHSKSVHSIAISWDGQILVSGSEDTKIKIWDLHTGKLLHTLSEHSKPVYAVAISPDNQTLASGSADTTIRIWNLKTGKKRDTLIRHSRAVQSIAFSPDGKILVSGSEDTTIKIWNPDTGGNPLRDITTQTWSVYSVAVSCDGQILTIGSGDNIIRVLSLPTEELLRIVKGHSLAISPDGQTLATSQDKTIMIWNLLTGELLCNLRGHSGSVRTLSFSTNGRLLASGSYDKTIRIWQRS